MGPNDQPDRPHDLVVDATAMPAQRAGAGVYSYNLVRALVAALPADVHLTVLDRWGAFADLAGTPGLTLRHLEAPTRARRMLWEQTALPIQLQQAGATIYHSLHHSLPLVSGGVALVSTVHDVTFRLLPWRYTYARRVYMHLSTLIAARRARRIIVPSHSVARDLARLYRVRPARIRVIAEAASPMMRVIDDPAALEDLRQRYRLPRSFILSVGTLEPGKNRETLFRALAILIGRGIACDLVVTGQAGWGNGQGDALAVRLGIERRVHYTGYVADADLPLLYNLADVFVYPSWREGFGLPPLEAMACGTAVVSSDQPAMPDVLGDAALYAAPGNAGALADQVQALLLDLDRRASLVARGRQRAARYSWQAAARATLEVYRELLPSVGERDR